MGIMSYINTVVDKVYVINLDKDVERLQKIDSQLQQLGISYERFPAILGAKLPASDPRFSAVCNSFCPPSLRGCAASHHTLWTTMLEKKYDAILILEDDAILSDTIQEQVRHTLEKIPPDWDILYLGCGVFCSESEAFDSAVQATLQMKPEHIESSLHKVPGSVGAHGMIVRRSFVEKVQHLPIHTQIDGQILLWSKLLKTSDTPLNLYGLHPQAIRQSSMEGHGSGLGDSYPPILMGLLRNVRLNSMFNLDWFLSERFLQIGPIPITIFAILIFILGFVAPPTFLYATAGWFLFEAAVSQDYVSAARLLFLLAIGPLYRRLHLLRPRK